MASIRTSCIFCKSEDLKEKFPEDFEVPQSIRMISEPDLSAKWSRHNIQICSECGTYQIKYLADPEILYGVSHFYPYGFIREVMDIVFSTVISRNKDIDGLIEIGSGLGQLSELLLSKQKYEYTVIDPSYVGPTENRRVIRDYCENVDLNQIQGNTLVMSHVLEHLYEPLDLMEKLKNNTSIKYIYMCHPDFDAYPKLVPAMHNFLHLEHTFYIENQFVIGLFEKYGFVNTLYTDIQQYNNSVIYEFKRSESCSGSGPKNSENMDLVLGRYYDLLFENIKKLNKTIEDSETDVYMWPCSVHSTTMLNYGLNYKKLKAFLDNSPAKFGSYMYGYNVPCLSFKEIVSKGQNIVVILNGGCYNIEIETEDYPDVRFVVV